MSNLVKQIGTTFNKVVFQTKKHAPEILMVSGVVGVLTSAVMACKATTKVGEILEKTKEDIDSIHAVLEDEDLSEEYDYTEEVAKKDLVIVYTQTGVKLAKLYAPSIILGTLSITSILASNNILRKRNVALAAAYATVDSTFKKYRNRVIERFGEKVDKELRYNVKAVEIEEKTTDAKGKEKTVKKTIEVADDPNLTSDYARFFDESSLYWQKDAEYNLTFLKAQQSYANNILQTRGRLFLNEVYDMLGIPRTKAGQVVGWIYDPNDEHDGDNYVDFGIYDIHRARVRDFVNGYERSILLDFNVDGNIWDLWQANQ